MILDKLFKRSLVSTNMTLFFLIIALSNYQLAKLAQQLILFFLPGFSYIWSLSLPWLMIGFLPILFLKLNVFSISLPYLRKNIKEICIYVLLVIAGLALFVNLGVTSYFHAVKYPFIFFIITPIVEELIFRGWLYDWTKKRFRSSPVLVTAILFGLHHLQYFGFRITPFAVFQVAYTFILGLLFGKIRAKSGSVYLSILLHILINYVSCSF